MLGLSLSPVEDGGEQKPNEIFSYFWLLVKCKANLLSRLLL